jgi:hypothetical protein
MLIIIGTVVYDISNTNPGARISLPTSRIQIGSKTARYSTAANASTHAVFTGNCLPVARSRRNEAMHSAMVTVSPRYGKHSAVARVRCLRCDQ